MKTIQKLLVFVFLMPGCAANDNDLGSILFTTDVASCSFQLFDSAGRLIASSDVIAQSPVSVTMTESGIFVLQATSGNAKKKDVITYRSGLMEYCISFQ
jgi:hypothetical protein